MTKRTPLVCLAVTVPLAPTAGVAPVVHSPFTQGVAAYALERDGVEFALVTAVPIASAAFRHTVPSAIGAGLRLLARGVVPR